jgi:hypothetical protein
MRSVLTRTAAIAATLIATIPFAGAETLLEYSAEHRYQLDYHVPDAVLAKFIPAGFEPNIATQGAAKDANMRLIFIDRVDVVDKDNKPVNKGSNRIVYMAVPIRNTATMQTGQMIIAGLTEDAADAPGPFGVYTPATVKMSRSYATENGVVMGTEDWDFTGRNGEKVTMHVKYERGVAAKSPAPGANFNDTRYWSGKDPNYVQLHRNDQGLDIMKNVTTQPADRVKEWDIKVSGGVWGDLFPASAPVLSWDGIQWSNRTVFLP